MNFCSQCGSAALLFRIPKGDNRPRFVCTDCGTIHYQNPNMVVGCLPVYEGKILLCKRAIAPREGYWNLPAGYLENGETAEDGAKRETMEEAGVKVDILRMHALYSIPRINQIYLFFLGKLPSPELNPGEESLDARLFAPEEIPYDQMAFPSSTFAIKHYLRTRHTNYHGVFIGGWKEGFRPKTN
ncbi:MAG: NUDIX hydrolase [Bacteroidota bacterium]